MGYISVAWQLGFLWLEGGFFQESHDLLSCASFSSHGCAILCSRGVDGRFFTAAELIEHKRVALLYLVLQADRIDLEQSDSMPNLFLEQGSRSSLPF